MKYDYDIVIIGAGSAGMVAAEAAANMGVKVALVERAQVGGDCLRPEQDPAGKRQSGLHDQTRGAVRATSGRVPR